MTCETDGPTDQTRLGQVNRLVNVELWNPPAGADGHLREERGVADADGCVGLGESALGGGNVRTPLDKLRGHAGGNGWRRVDHGFYRDGKIGGYFADEHGDGVLILRAQQAHVDGRRLRRFERGLGLSDGNVIAHAGVVLGLVVVERFLIGRHGFVEDLLQHVLAANLKVIFRQAGLLGEFLDLEIGRAYLGGILRFADFIADLAPEIGRPGNVDRSVPKRGLLCQGLPAWNYSACRNFLTGSTMEPR